MEIVDKFDNKRLPLNKTTDRYNKVKGEYNQSVHVWFLNSKNELLLQKRADTKRVYPGMWAITGGAVDSGETTLDALFRECKEELDVDITLDETELLLSCQRIYDFVDIYLIKKDINIKDITMQEDEVQEVKWITIDEYKAMEKEGKIPPSITFYSDFVLKIIETKLHDN